jgi:hypothetical protein
LRRNDPFRCSCEPLPQDSCAPRVSRLTVAKTLGDKNPWTITLGQKPLAFHCRERRPGSREIIPRRSKHLAPDLPSDPHRMKLCSQARQRPASNAPGTLRLDGQEPEHARTSSAKTQAPCGAVTRRQDPRHGRAPETALKGARSPSKAYGVNPPPWRTRVWPAERWHCGPDRRLPLTLEFRPDLPSEPPAQLAEMEETSFPDLWPAASL